MPLWEGARPCIRVDVVPSQLIVRPFAVLVWFFTFLLPVTIFSAIFAHVTGMLDGLSPGKDFIFIFVAIFRHCFSRRKSFDSNSVGITQRWNVMPVRVLKLAWNPRPVEPSLKFSQTCEFEENILNVRAHSGPFHCLFYGLQVEDQLSGLVIKPFVKLMHCAR
jgi:hypothetical protein